ncbi:hypothetical protein SEPCBS119000_000655 [Sporothrix epigloea]|uniref:Uncharacterized protein n=1 Tax=Sporothrix epigloea TaxID=1892477 RepID=A0ABP0D808_9PEZI
MVKSTVLAAALAATAALAQSYTTIILTESATSTTTIVLPAWPTTWTTATPSLTGYPGIATSTGSALATATATAPATVPTAGAQSMMVLDRAAMMSMALFAILGLIAV